MNPAEVALYQKVRATFSPANCHDLTEAARRYVGARLDWKAVGAIETGPYAGQMCMQPWGADAPDVGWVPASDLSDIVAASN